MYNTCIKLRAALCHGAALGLFVLGLAVAGIGFAPAQVAAQTSAASEQACVAVGGSWDSGTCNAPDGSPDLNSIIATIINVLSVIVAIVAVIMIIWGGFKYITAAGDSSKLGSAKNTIIYAVIGLVIAALAQAIVYFVLETVTGTGSDDDENASIIIREPLG